ncbi:MAG TPA: asparagine synthase (glutamine-hydrolyzing) [Candidatus Dormibacteraeota bacterium]|nr:asparagine synthase (glutamine-hydrolyzing) [Candidatus Dormibacteraeota bacterium]
MCGIFGIVARNAQIPAGLLERGTQSLAHRGPDDSGTILLRDAVPDATQIGLGNRRLAILDLSPLAHQPMCDAETGNWIVYNGEIYNFRDVRAELARLGTSFISHSDTEVVLKAYARWGEECLTKFRGMFAFAIWDGGRHRLFVARDPMGIKPLYYAAAGPYFVFASEIRTLLGTDLLRPRIDPAGLENFLTFGSAYDPLTLVDGIRALPAGHVLVWEGGALRQSAYWDLIDEPAAGARADQPTNDEALASADLRPILEEAVRMQLVSDVPVGVFLSGGIDSSALVSILSRDGVTPSTFSIVFREADFSEAEHSRAIAAKFHTDHHEINASQADVLAAIPDALRAMDLPTMDGVNTYFVSRETRKAGVKVALSGLGGDEVFAGYSSFRTIPRMERIARMWKHVPDIGRGGVASAFGALAPASDQNRKLALLMLDNEEALHPYFVSRMLFTPEQRSLLLRKTDNAISALASASQRDCLNRSLRLDPVNRVSYLESRCYMLNTLLRDADFMSMSQGLEVRVPLIDHQLAKAVLGLPGKWKLNGTPKKLLVESLQGSLPDEIVHRPKRGFTLPFEHWMREELRPEIEPVLDAKRVDCGPLGDLLSGGEVQRIWREFLAGTVSWTRPWSLYVLQRWCELHL